jgi:hypothetical protein
MKHSALALTLAFIAGTILSATTVGSIAYSQIESHNNKFKDAQSDILIDHAMSTCQYGSEMFYVARGIDVLDANYLALSDCEGYLADNGKEWFINFYGLQ